MCAVAPAGARVDSNSRIPWEVGTDDEPMGVTVEGFRIADGLDDLAQNAAVDAAVYHKRAVFDRNPTPYYRLGCSCDCLDGSGRILQEG